MAQVNIQYTADISQLNSKLDQIIQKQDQLISSSKKAGDEMVSANKRAGESVDSLGNQFTKIGGLIAAAFSVNRVIEFAKSVIDTERKLELLQNRLNFVAGSAQDGEKLFQRLVSTSKSLGINIEVLAEGMAAFGISATQAGFSASKAEQIFLKMSAGLRAAGATSLQSQRAFFALQQMIDKGVVSAEELRRQLAEALPGATSLMVKAYNNLHPKQQVTMEQFIKLQESGKILSREILPEFANVIEKEFAPALAGKKESLDAAIDRVNTQFTLLKSNLANSAFIKTAAATISTELERVNAILNSNFTAMQKAGMVLNLFTSNRSSSIIVANELIKTEEELVKVQKEINEEGIANARRISTLKGDEKKQAMDELSRQRLIFEGMVKAGTATKEQIRSLERIKATQQELFDLEVQSASNSEAAEEERRKQREQRLKDEVALAKIRVEQAEKGSIEENNARANLAKKQGDLDMFMSKSSAEMQLARVVSEKKANEEIEIAREKTADALSQDVVEDEIDPSKDPNLKAIDKTLETYRKNKDKISEAIAAPFMDATQKEMVAATNYYIDLIKLTEEGSEERRQLEEALQKELDNIKDRAAEKDKRRNEENIREAARMVSRVASEIAQISQSFAEAERDIMKNNLDASMNMLNAKLQAGLISEREYNEQINLIRKKQFKIDQDAAIAKVQIDTALAILNLFTQMNPFLALGLTPVIIGIADQQVTAIKSAPMPTFHDGGIDIGGDAKKTSGELKSDEFIAKLQRGESVIDRQDTRKYKDELSAIRDGRFEDYIASKYIIPAMERSQDRKQPASSSTSMEMAFQAAEMVNAIKGNKVIKLHKSSIKELTANSGTRSADKILARRSFR
jgi:tape measure domain-containing protein